MTVWPHFDADGVTLYHGDAFDPAILPLWTDADAMVTDPPYGIDYVSNRMSADHRYRQPADRQRRIVGDATTEARDAALRAFPGKPVMMFGHWRIERPPRVRYRLIWHKTGRAPGPNGRAPWFGQDEEIYVMGEGWQPPPVSNIYTTTEPRQSRGGLAAHTGHPTPKPVALMERLLSKLPPDTTVVDPFAGSGATLIAARNLGMSCIGVEVEERYVETATRRLEQGANL